MNLDKATIRKLQGLILFTVLLSIGLARFHIVLQGIGFIFQTIFPFILGGSIAFILSIPMNFFENTVFKPAGGASSGNKLEYIKACVSRPVSLILAIAVVLGIVFIVIAIVVPELARTCATLAQEVPRKVPVWIDSMELYLRDYPEFIAQLHAIEINWDDIFSSLASFFQNFSSNMLGSTIDVAKNIASAFASFFIGFAFACYVLLQKETLARQCKKLLYAYLPKAVVESALRICTLTHSTFASFLSGQCMEAIILGVMFFISMSVLNFPYALLVGVLIAFTALIPIFGAFIGCFVGVFLILTVDPMQAVAFVALFLVLQQIEGNFIYPHVVGSSVGLPSIWVLVAVSVGGKLMGIVGMLLFIPIISILYTLLKESVSRQLENRNIEIE